MQKTQLTTAIQEFERLKEAATSLRDKLYLDGVIAVLVGYLPQEREDIERAYAAGFIDDVDSYRATYFTDNYSQYKP